MPLITVNDIQMYYESRGTGAPLVVLGGLGNDVSELSPLIDPLARQFRVIAPDHRGAGRSDKPDGPYSIEQMARDVAVLLDHLTVPRAHVLGLSMGGRIAMALALDNPERVDRLVLVATAPRAAGNRRLVRLGMLTANLPLLRSRYPQPRRALKAQFDATTAFDCTDRLGAITAPTLIVHGRSDRVAPFALAAEMHAQIPGSRFVPVDGGHLFLFTGRHGRFFDEVTAFLTETPT